MRYILPHPIINENALVFAASKVKELMGASDFTIQKGSRKTWTSWVISFSWKDKPNKSFEIRAASAWAAHCKLIHTQTVVHSMGE